MADNAALYIAIASLVLSLGSFVFTVFKGRYDQPIQAS